LRGLGEVSAGAHHGTMAAQRLKKPSHPSVARLRA
jgi:hypothetical protein